MVAWPKQPIIYEINTWVWLHELSQVYQRPVTLGDVPPQEWDEIASLEIDAVWLMGVWERSPAGVSIARQHQGLLEEARRILPDFTLQDVVGSPYCVHRYLVDGHLGGPAGLAAARQRLAERGLRLVLDFVPNHLATDHHWISAQAEYFIQGDRKDLTRAPGEFFESGGRVFASGRDPYFPPWTDVAQLNAFHPGLRQAAKEALIALASQCDGVRCDMAMLLLNAVFEKTWGSRAGARPVKEYWAELIPAVRQQQPGFLFIAEAYWDLEEELQQLGFDFCYDKRLYDRLVQENAEAVHLHLLADPAYQEKLVRFIENHDEPRAAATFSFPKQRAAAVTIATLPGAKLFHQGQFEGSTVHLPVQLGRRPIEVPNQEIKTFYHQLLRSIHAPAFRQGGWQLCQRNGWPDNTSTQHLVAWGWRNRAQRYLIVVNLSDASAQGLVCLPWDDLRGKSWQLVDAFTRESYKRDGGQMLDSGLYVSLEPWGFHFLKFAGALIKRGTV